MNASVFLLGVEGKALESCQRALDRLNLPWEATATPEEVIRHAPLHSLVFLALNPWSMKGLSELRGRDPSLEIVALGGESSIPEATEAMRRGAMDYLPHPVEEPMVAQSVRRWQERVEASAETANPSEMITLMQLGRTLTSTLDLEDLYEQIIEQVQRAFQPDTVSLMLLNERVGRLRLVVQRGLPDMATGTEVSIEESIAGRVVQEGRPQLLLGGLEGTDFETLARRRNRIASAMSVPLEVKHRTLGVLNVNRYEGRANYSEKDAMLLHIFAAQIAIALQNAQLYESLRQERDRIVEAQEEVRRELARDLHDGLTQMLATLAMKLDHLRALVKQGNRPQGELEADLAFLRGMARQTVQDARTMTFGLRPLVLETQGLVAALEHYLATLRETDARTTYHFSNSDCLSGATLAPTVARMIFAILQEAINNARKHAKAKHIWVAVECEGPVGAGRLLRASVRDDGIGFDVYQVEGNYDQRFSFGLHNMKERAALIDATLQMESSPHGTLVELVAPWREG